VGRAHTPKKPRKKAQTLQSGPVNPLFSEEWRRQVVQQFSGFVDLIFIDAMNKL
jgi:hypothetical protein